MTVDSIESLLNKINELEDKSFDNVYDNIKDTLEKYKIKLIYEPNKARVVLTRYRNKSDYETKIVSEANGIILDTKTWKVLAMPIYAINPSPKYSYVRHNIKNYEIYPINDGTTINLYWYENKWRLGSSNAYELNNLTYMGGKTYWEMFIEVVGEDVLSKLKKDCSYVIGFRHHDLHPFLYDPQKYWLIEAYKLSTLESCKSEFNFLPTQDAIRISKLDILENNNTNAYINFIKNKTSYADKAKDYSNIIHYGYILRTSYKTAKGNSNILLESTLLKRIRQCIYNMSKEKKEKELVKKLKITNENRFNYFTMRSYLDFTYRKYFIELFPQQSSLYLKFDKYFSELEDNVIKCLRNKKYKDELFNAENKNKDNQLCKLFYNHLNNNDIKLTGFDFEIKGILDNFIKIPQHIHLFRFLFN